LAFVSGNDNSTYKNNYFYRDTKAPSSTCYYSLKQIENNSESFNYSKIISVSPESQEFSLLSFFYENSERKLDIEVIQNHISDIDLTYLIH